jgi:hypothetical protein
MWRTQVSDFRFNHLSGAFSVHQAIYDLLREKGRATVRFSGVFFTIDYRKWSDFSDALALKSGRRGDPTVADDRIRRAPGAQGGAH